MVCHQYGISALVAQRSFHGESRSGIMKCQLFSQAKTSFDTSETSKTTVGPSMVQLTGCLDDDDDDINSNSNNNNDNNNNVKLY